MLGFVITFALLAGAALGSALVLALSARVRQKVLPWLIAYATGTLLGAALLGMIPEALTLAPAGAVSAALLAGLVGFMALERLLIWRHGHETEAPARRGAGALILVGDAFHNFVDGIIIAAAFLVSAPLGIAAALAVIAHEIPQEVGDFAILLDSGYSTKRAFVLNTLSATATLPGALIGYFWLPAAREAIPFALAISAASFLYIAIADLLPTLRKRMTSGALQFILILAGIATIA